MQSRLALNFLIAQDNLQSLIFFLPVIITMCYHPQFSRVEVKNKKKKSSGHRISDLCVTRKERHSFGAIAKIAQSLWPMAVM